MGDTAGRKEGKEALRGVINKDALEPVTFRILIGIADSNLIHTVRIMGCLGEQEGIFNLDLKSTYSCRKEFS